MAPFARLVPLILSALFLTISFASGAVTDQGQYIARIGDCVSCHSAPGGEPYAGGLRMSIPFGAIYTTNITPDKATGIGGWNFADFDRALRRGIAKDGHHLYPAMPYPSFAKMSDADMHALYGFIMQNVKPVHQPNRTSEIVWPLDMRWPLAIWNWLFVDPGEFRANAAYDTTWNRGAYLVEGLGHCGACHTPRGPAWNELATDGRDRLFLTGATLEFWSAPDLRGDTRTGLGTWSPADIVAFLKTGHNAHGTAFGTMGQVTENSLSHLSDADLGAIAVYLKSLSPYRPAEQTAGDRDAVKSTLPRPSIVIPGMVLYQGYCLRCHGADGAGGDEQVPPLAANPAIVGPDPTSVIHMILDGGAAANRGTGKTERMPPFRMLLSDEALADITSFVRQGWGNDAQPVGTEDARAVRIGTSANVDQLARGRALIEDKGCAGCHRIPGVSISAGLAGPPLDDIGRRTMIAGVLANNPDNMTKWLQAPQRVKPGDAMPDLGLSERDARDIAAFLMTLRD